MSDRSTLGAIVATVNQMGCEIGVTVLCGGVMITGMVTPVHLFNPWLKEVVTRAGLAGGTFSLPSGQVPPPTPSQLAAAKAKFDETGSPDPDHQPVVVLRNAVVLTAQTAIPMPYMVIEMAHVAAWMPGNLNINNAAPIHPPS